MQSAARDESLGSRMYSNEGLGGGASRLNELSPDWCERAGGSGQMDEWMSREKRGATRKRTSPGTLSFGVDGRKKKNICSDQ